MNNKAIMVVMNDLNTDARVQRSARAIQDVCGLTVIGTGDCCDDTQYEQILIDLSSNNNVQRYFEFVHKVKRNLRQSKCDLLYAHDYYSASLAYWFKKRHPDSIVIYDSHELIFPALGFPQSKRNAFFSYFERKAVANADLVICASQDRAKLMQDYYNMQSLPLVIENISQLPVSHNPQIDLLMKQWEAVSLGTTSLVYAGVLSAGRRIDALIDIVKHKPETTLLIIGDGPDYLRLKNLASDLIPGRFLFTGSVPYQNMGVLLNKCDIGYISYPTDSLNNTYCASNKIYEYASVNLPMIAIDNPTLRSIFDVSKIGIINNDLKEAFDYLANNIEEYRLNCKKFTSQNQWREKEKVLRDAVISLLIRKESY